MKTILVIVFIFLDSFVFTIRSILHYSILVLLDSLIEFVINLVINPVVNLVINLVANLVENLLRNPVVNLAKLSFSFKLHSIRFVINLVTNSITFSSGFIIYSIINFMLLVVRLAIAR